MDAKAIWAELEQLPEFRRHQVLARACRAALEVWRTSPVPAAYVDGVVGVRHEVDFELPARALDEIERAIAGDSVDPGPTLAAYLEPITALQDDELTLAGRAERAYLAIYNLYRLVLAPGPTAPSELVVFHQALTATLDDPHDRAELDRLVTAWWPGEPPN